MFYVPTEPDLGPGLNHVRGPKSGIRFYTKRRRSGFRAARLRQRHQTRHVTLFRIILAGTPPASTCAGRLLVTTAPAATTDPSPIEYGAVCAAGQENARLRGH